MRSNESILKRVTRYIVFHSIDVLSIIVGILRPAPDKLPDKAMNILVIDIAMLGDLLMTTPLLSGIKECFPESQTSLVCTPWAIEAIQNNSSVDHIHTYEAFWEDRGNDGKLRIKHALSTFKLLKFYFHHNFDYAFIVNTRQQPLVSFIGFLSGARIRIGIKFPIGYRFLTHSILDSCEHLIKTKLKLLLEVCPDSQYSSDILFNVTEESKSVAAEFFARNYGKANPRNICITPSTLQTAKQWKIKSWVELINKLNDDGFGVVLAGGKADWQYIDRIYSNVANKKLCKQIAGQYTLNQFAAIMQSSSCLISIDSAPVHVASALKIPCIILFNGVYDFKRLIPIQSDYISLSKDVDCSICLKGCGDPKCMNFTVEEVYFALNNLINRKNKYK